ncbi:unnamed protein product [Pleuronectes platessa]|uniref:Bromo domain-containing protein n=1 Tax=Pleuronectes platessa TaxID=8262 RepID=A0A9N7VWM8_PLEPL|nr:unnamed protein product [Pleuronectes platessa]
MEVDIHQLQQVEALERRVVSAGLQIKGWMHPEPQSEREDLVYQEDNAWRRPNNPLDIAVMRLAELERGIDRSSEEEVTPGMRLWHQALGEVRSSAQLSLCIQQLQKSSTGTAPSRKVLLAELEAHQDAGPILTPVNLKAKPWYKRIIKKPMDFTTIGKKLSNNQYLNFETFVMDLNLVFDNSLKYDEDDSTIGRAGISMKEFFAKRWAELLKQN